MNNNIIDALCIVRIEIHAGCESTELKDNTDLRSDSGFANLRMLSFLLTAPFRGMNQAYSSLEHSVSQVAIRSRSSLVRLAKQQEIITRKI